jgi:hypothetical protein
MATLLEMVNQLRVLLREEQVSAISTTDDYTQLLIKVINRSAKSVLESRVWSFDKRFDGIAVFPGAISGSDTVVYNELSPSIVLVDSSTSDIMDSMFSPNALSVRFRLTDDTDRPELSYSVVSSFYPFGTNNLAISPDWQGESSISRTATYSFYVTDRVLPSTVRKVLSVRDEEQPRQLIFTEDEIFSDRANPKPDDEQGDSDFVIVGGTTTASFDRNLDTTGAVGMRMRLASVPTDDTMLFYTYVYRHPEMSVATDTLTAVPDYVIGLIIDEAFKYCLSSNIESDPERASVASSQLTLDVGIAGQEDRNSPNRRRVLRTQRTRRASTRLGAGGRYLTRIGSGGRYL